MTDTQNRDAASTQADPGRMADAIRFLAMDAIERVGEGHQGVPLGMAEIATALYRDHLRFDPADPLWPDRDRVILSNGHGSMLLYALLYLAGYKKIGIEQIRTFRELGSHCAGHPEYDPAAGIEATTGPLGQGIANAVGMAVAEARMAAEFGRDLVDHRVWAFVGDGCLQEGIGQEAISLAGHLSLGRLTFLWDDNRITDDGATDLSISENVPARFRAADWHVVEVNGHDAEAVSAAMSVVREDPRPSLVACRTIIGKGIPRVEGQRGGHSARLFRKDTDAARKALGWDHPAFSIPDDLLSAWRATGTPGGRSRSDWLARLDAHPAAAEFRRRISGARAESWRAPLDAYRTHAAAMALAQPTVASSGDVCDALAATVPEMIVTCADLEAPTNHKRSRSAFTARDGGGSYLHCGVREHLMGAMVNGMAAHGGVAPVSVTYLAFSDYERPAMRLAALMGLPSIFVFSHDSIGVGRNGPTHQPVEILAAFRAMPNMLTFRPADAVETAEAWEIALERSDGPALLALTKQSVPALRRDGGDNLSRRGAYVLAEADGARAATILATGSEVSVAMAARDLLAARGVSVAVVSMPCWELFETQDTAYRNAVLGEAPRIGVEAAMRFGWDRWIGSDGAFVGMSGFGASAAAETLYAHFGITAEAVAAAVQS
ncbi:transketolase [uncultured Jannaschia sp.]|uniref:transketolase n=1 Tax=uncultured Jannaschia sp. TaxID=293347 RepID=UPI0026031C98|nr:transketolase [uncultured Jannaschia sp.]